MNLPATAILLSSYYYYHGASLIAQLVKKKSVRNAGDLGSIPWLGKCPGEGKDNPLQYSCPENTMGRGA